jgi:glutaredoxin
VAETAEHVILYTTPNCSACDRARADLAADGVHFEERSVMARQEWYDEVLQYSISVPVLIRNGKVEVGWKGDIGCAIA